MVISPWYRQPSGINRGSSVSNLLLEVLILGKDSQVVSIEGAECFKLIIGGISAWYRRPSGINRESRMFQTYICKYAIGKYVMCKYVLCKHVICKNIK